MRPGAILLNTSRGDVVDETALLEALDAGEVRAGLDVYADEPGTGTAEWKSALAQHPSVVATHHIGASTKQAQRAIAAGVVEIVDAFAEGEARNCVNLAPSRLGVGDADRPAPRPPGVLARVLDLLSAAGLNVEHMENRVFRGGEAAVASIDVAGPVADESADRASARSHMCSGCPWRRWATMRSDPGAGRARARPVTAVRPFRARLVRQDRSPGRRLPMLDALPPPSAIPDLRSGIVDPEAYAESEPRSTSTGCDVAPTSTSGSSVT